MPLGQARQAGVCSSRRGGGIEVGITSYLSARAEYLYVDSSSFNVAYIGPATITGHVQESLVRAGLNLRLPFAH